MDEFPEFRFSQSQVSTYKAMEEECPEMFETIKNRIEDGDWEVTASTWVEGDKNMASGESQARQILYAKKYFEEKFDMEGKNLNIDWEPDTFGHPATTPKILRNAGINYYYLHRPGGKQAPVPRLFNWRGSDGSEVLVWNDQKLTYNNHVRESEVKEVLDLESETGVKEYMIVYGVGDHGGGPSREDLEKIEEMKKWPIFPKVKFSTVSEFFEKISQYETDLPVIEGELNYIFRGCYSSQSRVKNANRKMENELPMAETLSCLANCLGDFEYPEKRLEKAWRKALFNQFHDILPGSGIAETYEHSQANFQSAMTTASMIRHTALEEICSTIDAEGDGIPIVVYNPASWEKNGKVRTVIYEPPESENLKLVDEEGNEYPVQVLETLESLKEASAEGKFSMSDLSRNPDIPTHLAFDIGYDHDFSVISFTAEDVPPLGYKTFWLKEGSGGDGVDVTEKKDEVSVENEFYRITVDAKSGSLTSIYDKKIEKEFVPEGEMSGLLSVECEAPHPMSAWERDQITEVDKLNSGGRLQVVEDGPVTGSVKCTHHYKDSEIEVEIKLQKGIPEIFFKLDTNWEEVGNPEIGVPALKADFPVNVENPVHTHDIPFGSTRRSMEGKDVPAQEWGDVQNSETNVGLTVANDTTYGYSGRDNKISLTLLRSTYEPDPYPEIGRRIIKYSLYTHGKDWNLALSAKLSTELNRPFIARRVRNETGTRPAKWGFFRKIPENVKVTCLKKELDNKGLILRVNNLSKEPQETVIETELPIKSAEEVNLLEDRKDGSKLKIRERNNLNIKMGPEEVKTLRLNLEELF